MHSGLEKFDVLGRQLTAVRHDLFNVVVVAYSPFLVLLLHKVCHINERLVLDATISRRSTARSALKRNVTGEDDCISFCFQLTLL